jgi:murein DD-endopeptidase MepM/ murein hydrolase activator NlpD
MLLIACLALPFAGGLAYGAFFNSIFGPPEPPVVDLEAEIAAQGLAVTPAVVAEELEEEVLPATVARRLTVARGDTLMSLLTNAGIARGEAHAAITALRKVFSPRNLRPGQSVGITLAASDGEVPRLLGLDLRPDAESGVEVARDRGQAFVARAFDRPLTREPLGARGRIESSLALAGREQGVPPGVLVELIRAFSFDVDFQREVRRGDSFEVVYETFFDETGQLAKTGRVLYAALTLSGDRLELYDFTPKSGIGDYFNAKGQAARKSLMRTPIDGARLSSRFGMRRHPVLGYSKMHRGVDFAAPPGTPIYAAGSGVVESAGWNGGYGRYVRIRHNGTYKTAYAHMKGIARGIRRGKRVRQGQVIGYVGSTGRSTGPHLHYEVMVKGRQANPLRIKLPSGQKLKGGDLKKFEIARQEIDALRERIFRRQQLVQATCSEAPEFLETAGC